MNAHTYRIVLMGCALPMLAAATAHADALHDWNSAACQTLLTAKAPPGPAYRAIAITQTAVYESINAITGHYSGSRPELPASPDASTDAAIAAATHSALVALVPAQQPDLDAAFQAALSKIPDGAAKSDGIAVGEMAAARLLSERASDGFDAVESYRPLTTPGTYVPTTLPLATQWPKRKPWNLSSPDQFRPGPPPALDSERWARDLNECKEMGGKSSAARTPEQTDVIHFWETTSPIVYFPLVHSVTQTDGRDLTSNARLLALAGQAMDDALIAVFDAKYTYSFWRPLTAIRNADMDDNAATEREPTWLPAIDTPMHPEYPCAHCTIAAAVAAVIAAEHPSTPLQSTSPGLPGKTRTWSSTEALVTEVINARVWSGVHYRNSGNVGAKLGRHVGERAVSRAPQATK